MKNKLTNHTKWKFFFMIPVLVLICAGQTWAEEEEKQDQLSLEDLLNTKVDTAAKYEQFMHEVPASITVITAEDID